MKKKYLGLLLIALMMITVIVVVSCKKDPADTKVTVTFDTQGATNTIDSVQVEPGAVVAKPKKTPKRAGYTFLGWFDDKDGTKAHDFKAKVTENITVYACWRNMTTYEHSDPILPAGSVKLSGNTFSIPMDWSDDVKGMTDLPDVTYSFSGERTSETNVTEALKNGIKTAMETENFFAETPKNIIFLFSDGWGVTEVNMSREYKGELIMDSLPYITESKTDSYKKYKFDGSVDSDYSSHTTTDSCAGGTQVLAGYKTRYGYISLDVDADPVTTLIEAAHGKGWKTAVVTNDNIVDATPADAMIHDTNRYHSDVLYYKALKYALAEQGLDLLMGWDWGKSTYFSSGTWAERFLNAEKGGIKDAIDEMDDLSKLKYDSSTNPITFFTDPARTTLQKAELAGFSIYYHLWESQDPARLNSFMTWTTTGAEDLAAYEAWLDSPTGLAKAIADVQSAFPNPSAVVNRFTTFEDTIKNSDTSFAKPVLGSWTKDGAKYDASSPNRGYLLHGDIGKNYPSWPEMVAYTLYQMDKEADAADTGFFCIIENTCTDGWGHSGNDSKIYGMMNEVQCFDEGVAIAVKYVLEHPDTLLVISADHETGNFKLKSGWEDDYTKVSSGGTDHSSQRVPLYAFGAGADNFSAEAIYAKYNADAKAGVEEEGYIHEGWITGALMGELMTGDVFGQQEAGAKTGDAFSHGNSDDVYGGPLKGND